MSWVIDLSSTSTPPAKQKNVAVVYDTDIHGGMSGYIAILSLSEAGYEITKHFSNFAKQPPATTAYMLADSIEMIVKPGEVGELYLLDIPVDARNPDKYVETLIKYPQANTRLIYIDHHEPPKQIARLYEAGANVYILPSSYQMSLTVPSLLGVSNKRYEKLALIGATADFDESIAYKVTGYDEETITEYLDTAWKGGFAKNIPEIRELTPKYGNTGAIVEYFRRKNYDADDILLLAREYGSEVPYIKYTVVRNVAVAKEIPPPGLGWKTASKICRLSGAPVAVVIQYIPQLDKYAVLVATYWRKKTKYADTVDEIVKRHAGGYVITGHPGARSITVGTREEAEKLRDTLVEALSAELETALFNDATDLLHSREVAIVLSREADILHKILRNINDKLEEIISLLRKTRQD